MFRMTIAKCLLVLGIAAVPAVASADSGFYIGGSAGGATLEGEVPATAFSPAFDFDEDDTAFKVFGGYRFEVTALDLSIEAGYVDFGQPEVDVLGSDVEFDTTGINLWGIAGIEAGPVDLFAKLGYVAWDVEASGLGTSVSDDGTDLGYGLGLGFNVGPVQIRGEYEFYDVDDADLSMLSLGIVYLFD